MLPQCKTTSRLSDDTAYIPVAEARGLTPSRVKVRFRFSQHAVDEMLIRSVERRVVEAVLEKPEQIVPASNDNMAYQSRVALGNTTFLVRVIVDETRTPPTVVTVYRTTKIAKYWSQNESNL